MDAWSPQIDSIRNNIRFLSEDEVIAQHDDADSFKPDFLLHRPLSFCIDDLIRRAECPEDALCVDSVLSLSPFYQTAMYSGDPNAIESVIAGSFISLSGCFVHRRNTVISYPTLLGGTEGLGQGEFALSDSAQTVDLLHPALVVGVPRSHREELPTVPPVSHDLKRLQHLIWPNLIAHVLNWITRSDPKDDAPTGASLRRRQGTTSFPPWFMIFGLCYDYHSITIVAHIPFLETECQCEGHEDGSAHISCLSCVVDTIPFPGLAGSSHASTDLPFMCNMKAALLLYAVQRQAFRMASLWDGADQLQQGLFSLYPDHGPDRPRSPSAWSDDKSIRFLRFCSQGDGVSGDDEDERERHDFVQKWREDCYRLLDEN
ncbi:hypothetical protein OF83DRAFT_255838 [Amylostereum chailletii]|nr:hypothetical protein OF83DRAFT_255838 [Amylostereum chailletii]